MPDRVQGMIVLAAVVMSAAAISVDICVVIADTAPCSRRRFDAGMAGVR